MPISEIEGRRAEKTLSEYCARRTNPAIRDQLEIVYRLEGNYAYIAERRPDWMDASIVLDHDVAKFRFVVKDRAWVLFWSDPNSSHAFVWNPILVSSQVEFSSTHCVSAHHGHKWNVDASFAAHADMKSIPTKIATPLHFCADAGRGEKGSKMTKLLIGAGADVKAKDRNGLTALPVASEGDNEEVAKVLREVRPSKRARHP